MECKNIKNKSFDSIVYISYLWWFAMEIVIISILHILTVSRAKVSIEVTKC